MKLKTITQIKNLKNKTVLVRVDYNVALEKGKVLEPDRIERSFSTINFLLKNKAKVVLMSHLGRPDGKVVKEYSLQPIAKYLNKVTKKHVYFVNDCIGGKVQKKIAQLKAGQILLLENLRFYPGEKLNDAKFAQDLAGLADIYINDAFAVCHRAHASVSAITRYLPAYAGLNLISEIDNLGKLLKGFKKPAVAIIGGVKISTKIKVIEKFLKKYNYVLIGGALANNFFAAKKINIGRSIYDNEFLPLAKKILKQAKNKLILPIDVRISNNLKGKGNVKNVNLEDLNRLRNKKFYIIDIGPKTELYFDLYIKKANTLIWNGPMGMFEIEKYSHGSDYITQNTAIVSKGPAFGVAGGGETVALIEKLKLKKWFDFVSTAGGAMLEFLEGKSLPGLKPLIKK